MAERRMFARTIVDSDAFLDMPQSTQNLYFHLSMRADDDGFINNPKKIQRMVGSSDDDLKILAAKSFIIPFESGVVVIKHWRISNYLRTDRYKPTVYIEEFSRLSVKGNGAYTLENDSGIPMVSQVVDSRETQDSIGKVSIGKVSKEEATEKPSGSLFKYLQENHRRYAIDICGYSEEQYREATNWGAFGRNCWPNVKGNPERWIDAVLSAAYADKWCNGPKGKYSANAIFSAKVLSILQPEIYKRLAEADNDDAKARSDAKADSKYKADCEAAMADWTPEQLAEYNTILADRAKLYAKFYGDAE